jgi:hypothetical protein
LNWWNESFDKKLNETAEQIHVANTYLKFKNYKKAEMLYKQLLKEKNEFMLQCFEIEKFLEIDFYYAFTLFKQEKYLEVERILKALQTDLERTGLSLTLLSLKVAYYLTLNSFMLKNSQSTTESFASILIEQMEKINITNRLDKEVIFQVHLLKGKIHSDFTDEEKACDEYQLSLKYLDPNNLRSRSMVYFYLAQEKFRLADYPMLNNYASESLSLASINFKIDQDWGGGEEEEDLE